MNIELGPGLLFGVAKNTYDQFAPKLSDLTIEGISQLDNKVKMDISFVIENASIHPNGLTFTPAEWAHLAGRRCYMGFESGSASRLASETNIDIQISDVNPYDSRLEINSTFVITGGKIGGAGEELIN